jgi:hypothetical protein
MEFFEFFEISHFLKYNRSKTVPMCSTTKNVKTAEKKFENRSILANFSHIL